MFLFVVSLFHRRCVRLVRVSSDIVSKMSLVQPFIAKQCEQNHFRPFECIHIPTKMNYSYNYFQCHLAIWLFEIYARIHNKSIPNKCTKINDFLIKWMLAKLIRGCWIFIVDGHYLSANQPNRTQFKFKVKNYKRN